MQNDGLLEKVLRVCQSAGEAIMRVYQGDQDVDVQTKQDNSPVTEADLAAHDVLEKGLGPLLAGVPILSEESTIPPFDERSTWERYWLVDPLDGTKEFINKNGEFTVNVALIDRGVPVLGVVYAPVLDVSYLGLREQGAWKQTGTDRQSITTRSPSALGSQAFTIVASRRHGADEVQALIERVKVAFGEVEAKSMGSSLKLCLVAEGVADLYPRLALTSEWDTAAAQAVVEAAGGQVLTTALTPLRYNTKDELLNPYFYVVGDAGYDWPALL